MSTSTTPRTATVTDTELGITYEITECDASVNAHAYSAWFRNVTAPALVQEFLTDHADLGTEFAEFAQWSVESLEAVLWYSEALALFAAGVLDDVEVEDGAYHELSESGDGVHGRILRAVAALSFQWHYEVLVLAYSDHMQVEAPTFRCECGNRAEAGLTVCEWCTPHECTPAPNVSVSPSGAVARCDSCGIKWGLWDCACDFMHDCNEAVTA